MSNDANDPKRLVTLLVSILLLFLAYPFVEHRAFAPMFLQLLFTGVLVSALFSVSATASPLSRSRYAGRAGLVTPVVAVLAGRPRRSNVVRGPLSCLLGVRLLDRSC